MHDGECSIREDLGSNSGCALTALWITGRFFPWTLDFFLLVNEFSHLIVLFLQPDEVTLQNTGWGRLDTGPWVLSLFDMRVLTLQAGEREFTRVHGLVWLLQEELLPDVLNLPPCDWVLRVFVSFCRFCSFCNDLFLEQFPVLAPSWQKSSEETWFPWRPGEMP